MRLNNKLRLKTDQSLHFNVINVPWDANAAFPTITILVRNFFKRRLILLSIKPLAYPLKGLGARHRESIRTLPGTQGDSVK